MLRAQIELHKDDVYSLCLRWIGDPDRAASATRRVLTDWARTRTRQPDPLIGLYREVVALCERTGIHPSLDMAPVDRRLHRLLEQMDERERPVLLLRDVVDLDVDVIARVLDLSRGSVVSRLQRARMKLALARGQMRDLPEMTLEIAEDVEDEPSTDKPFIGSEE